MRETRIFIINDTEIALTLFRKGDFVKSTEHTAVDVEVTGTVTDTEAGGLIVSVEWDQESYPSAGGNVIIGSKRMADGLELIHDERSEIV